MSSITRFDHLDPITTTRQSFYEFYFNQSIKFKNYKIHCYSVLNNGRIGRLVGKGFHQKNKNSYLAVVNGYDESTELSLDDRMGETAHGPLDERSSLYTYPQNEVITPEGYPNFYSPIMFFLVNRFGDKYSLSYEETLPHWENYNYFNVNAYVDFGYPISINSGVSRRRSIS